MPYLVLGYTAGTGAIDPNLSLLLHGDGDFSDSSSYNHSITTSATIGSGTGQFGDSMDFNNSTFPAITSSAFTFGLGEFTIDFWMKRDGAFLNYLAAGDADFTWLISTGSSSVANIDKPVMVIGNGSFWNYTLIGTHVVTDNVWHHIAVVRSVNDLIMFVDGQVSATLAIGSYDWVWDSFRLGGIGAVNRYVGSLDEFRMVKGSAEWTSNFTPPTAPY